MKKRYFQNNKGFSLVELLIIITIILTLASIVTPTLIRYIYKARKAVDIQQASVLFGAAELAYATSDDDAYYGYSVCVDDPNYKNFNTGHGDVSATADGYFNEKRAAYANEIAQGCYNMRPVAWCRGVRFDGDHGNWENAKFKSTIDAGKSGDKQRKYTDHLLWALCHEDAQGEHDHSGTRSYDGETIYLCKIRYTKEVSCKKISTATRNSALWIIYRRDDNAMPEVWTGYKDRGKTIQPLRRLYPDPATDYH